MQPVRAGRPSARTVLFLCATALLLAAPRPPNEPDRSPLDLALSPDGRWALTANRDADSASLVDLTEGRVTAECPVGRSPFGVAISPDGALAAVSNRLGDSITILRVAPPRLEPVATVAVGREPRGVAFGRDRVYVALAGEDAVVAVDPAGKIAAREPVGRRPWHLALTPDGRCLAVACVADRQLLILGTDDLKPVRSVNLHGDNAGHVAIAPDGSFAYVPTVLTRGFPTTTDNIDAGWVIANRLTRVPLDREAPREALPLDAAGKAAADLDGAAVGPDGSTVALTASGTHELLLLRAPLPFVDYGGFFDHIDGRLLRDPGRLRRVPLGGRPLGAAFTPDGARVVVANALSDALQIVDVETARLVRTIGLGSAPEPSAARRGEAIFHDATRSFGQWYSCHSCHVEGHTGGALFDTLNDGGYGKLKLTPSLRGVGRTGPWSWHGWQTDLEDLVRRSLTTTMRGPEPTEADLDALIAFLGTLDFPTPPAGGPAEAIRRGEALFKDRRCAECHPPPLYTRDRVYEVGLESPDDVYRGFNPPSLRGVGARGPFLHDGRAATLEDVLRRHHRPSQVNGERDLSETELADLAAFLKSL
jgi:YVTN family beta-propeller protein